MEGIAWEEEEAGMEDDFSAYEKGREMTKIQLLYYRDLKMSLLTLNTEISILCCLINIIF